MAFDQGGYPPQADQTDLLGDIFRAHRMAAGVSIEQVEYDLRIKAKYLEAIEDNDAGALPSRAYVDGFLRNYAAYLGLDPTAAVDQFTAENGQAPSNIPAVPIPPKARAKTDAASGGGATSPRRRTGPGPVRRSLVAAMPLLLIAGVGAAGYGGYVAARDAGLVPGNVVAAASSLIGADKSDEPDRLAAAEPTAPAPSAEEPTAPAPVAEAPAAAEDSRAETPAQRIAVVGAEPVTGRPDSLRYARAGATPYWRARPPKIEPVDGPVSEIEPKDAGVVRAEASPSSRWSSRSISVIPTPNVDAERIAAEARAALSSVLGPQPASARVASPVTALPATPDDAFGLEGAEIGTPEANAAEINTPEAGVDAPLALPMPPQGASTDIGPAVPGQPPRRFALIATADTWVQVSDASGIVAYTGILSAGEAYNIPSREGLRLRTGNAGGLYIEVEGERFGPLGNSGAIMRNVVLDPGAVRASFTLSRAASLLQ